MSQAYGKEFARVYNKMWGSFSIKASSQIMKFYEHKDINKSNRNLLDICCGTGQLALEFLKNGYQVTGLDLSPHMISYARENTREYETKGAVNFIEADASNFELKKEYGLAVSIYDSINHLNDIKDLGSCFKSVYQCVVKNGYFIFDLSTSKGLNKWNGMHIEDKENIFFMIKGIFDTDRNNAVTRVSGFIKEEDDLYSRFEEIVYNYVYQLDEVKKILEETGWNHVHFSIIKDLDKNIEEPETEDRIFVVAQK